MRRCKRVAAAVETCSGRREVGGTVLQGSEVGGRA